MLLEDQVRSQSIGLDTLLPLLFEGFPVEALPCENPRQHKGPPQTVGSLARIVSSSGVQTLGPGQLHEDRPVCEPRGLERVTICPNRGSLKMVTLVSFWDSLAVVFPDCWSRRGSAAGGEAKEVSRQLFACCFVKAVRRVPSFNATHQGFKDGPPIIFCSFVCKKSMEVFLKAILSEL